MEIETPINKLKLNKMSVKVRCLPHYVGDLPRYHSKLASGFDVRARIAAEVVLSPGERALVPTGLAFEIPPGFEFQARPRSGFAAKQGVTVLNAPGTIDADYRGEITIILVNHGPDPVTIRDQDRIAQLVLCPVWQAELVLAPELGATARGSGGFGSTGI